MRLYKSLSDTELTSFLKGGDRNAFSEIYDRYWGLLYRHARRMTNDDELAKDIVQDVFVSLWDRGSEIHFSHSLSAYLYSTTRNKVINLYDKEKVKTKYIASLTSFLKNSENVTDHLLRERLLSALIEQEISMLPKKMKEIFEMSRKANMSAKEIAANLELSDKTVKRQISNAIKILRLKFSCLMLLMQFISF
ncbi:RNA polymerase sigma-70 factor [Pedobacter sp. ASV1-7]|uniref:RNA polymerase sigma factor n=1 Tax=Pedobacter sp. ASV1-7 TaxID=3145237 RepID=UPI0032E91172